PTPIYTLSLHDALPISSAYRITFELEFLAARPIVWISDLSFLKNPSLSASKIPTNPTSGISNPSLKRFIPTKQSNLPSLNSLIRSEEHTSELQSRENLV